MAVDRAEVIAFLEPAIADAKTRVGPHSWEDKTWHDRVRAADHAIADQLKTKFGARIRNDWNGARVSMAGVSSTSTAGLGGALTNWLSAARRKAAAS